MNLQSLKQSITQMSDQELLAKLMEIRASRRTPKAETKAKAASKKPTKEVSLDAILASASPDMIAALISQLEGKK